MSAGPDPNSGASSSPGSTPGAEPLETEALANEVDRALEALWHGETASLDRLLDRTGDGGPSVREVFHGLVPQPAPGAAAAGSQISDYTIIREIGRGGMGVVYEAEQQIPRRRVALKVIRGSALGEEDDYRVRLFQREVNTLARLIHPGIATIYDAGHTASGQHFLVMELVSGATLLDHANGRTGDERPAPLDLSARLKLFATVCDTIHYAHQRGVIHRDLKPTNILVNRDHHPKVLDFGLAHIMDAEVPASAIVTQVGRVVGTLPYMSPEQACGQMDEVDTRSDIYSLGVILFELVTGSMPYDLTRLSPQQAARTICETPPRRPSSLNHALRGDLETIVNKALEKDPARRYQSAAALGDDLRRFLANEPILARPPTTFYQIRMFARRHHTLVAGIFVAVLTLLIGIVGTTSQAIRATRERDHAHAAESLAERRRAEAEHACNRAQDAEHLAAERQKTAEFRAYVSNIAAAHAALRANDVTTAHQQLTRAPYELRNWEWHFLHAALDGSRITLRGHTDVVWSVAYSPDGGQLASVSNDATVRIWDAASGTPLMVLRSDSSACRGLAYSPDGTRLATSTRDGRILIWDTRTAQRLNDFKAHTHVICGLAFSHDGRWLASGSQDSTARLWDAETFVLVAEFRHPDWVHTVALTPDGTRLATSCRDNIARIWDLTTGEPLLELTVVPSTTDWYYIHSWPVTLSPDGRTVATGGHDGLVKLWNATTGELQQTLAGHTARIRELAFSTSGTRLASSSDDDTARIWELSGGVELATLHGHEKPPFGVAFSPDGDVLATASQDGTVRLWDAHTCWESTRLWGHANLGIRSLAITRDGARMATGGEDGTVRTWDPRSGAGLLTLRGHAGPVFAVTYHPDGILLASGSMDRTIRLWNSETGQLVATLRGHRHDIQDLAFSPDGASLVSVARDGKLKLWDAATGAELLTASSDDAPLTAVAFTPEGNQLVTGSHTGHLEVWDLQTGQSLYCIPAHTEAIASLAFSSDGSRLVSAAYDGLVRLWDGATLAELATLKGHTFVVRAAAFSPDGTRIASVSWDRTLRIWDAVRYESVLSFRAHQDYAFDVAFSPDGAWLATTGKSIRLWEAVKPDRGLQQQRRYRVAAERLVDRLSAELADPADLLGIIRLDSTLSEQVRALALQIAHFRAEPPTNE